LTVNCRPTEQAEALLGCSPDVATWLHDEVVQRLSSVVAALGANGPLTRDDQARCHAELEVALRALGMLLEEGVERRPRRRLRTAAQAVRAGAAAWADGSVEVRVQGDAAISAESCDLVADFVAEALRNSVKHACPCTTLLVVAVDACAVRVEVLNDGVVVAVRGRGARSGLRLLAARARERGAAITARAMPPDGWSATIVLDRRREEGEHDAEDGNGGGA
jgi:signal transduction histidine kinase